MAGAARRWDRPQRPLWASTGTKDPSYSDVLYVEELIASDVVNTMPEATLRAFADHGNVSPREATQVRPRRPSAGQREQGIDLAAITARLERDGVRSFCDSYRDLLSCVERKAQRRRRRHGRAADRGTCGDRRGG